MIVAFLAGAEMVKLQAVGMVQEKQFGEILLRKAKAFDSVFDEKRRMNRLIRNVSVNADLKIGHYNGKIMTTEERKAALEAIFTRRTTGYDRASCWRARRRKISGASGAR